MATHSSTPADFPKSEIEANPMNDSFSRFHTQSVFQGVVLLSNKKCMHTIVVRIYVEPFFGAQQTRKRLNHSYLPVSATVLPGPW